MQYFEMKKSKKFWGTAPRPHPIPASTPTAFLTNRTLMCPSPQDGHAGIHDISLLKLHWCHREFQYCGRLYSANIITTVSSVGCSGLWLDMVRNKVQHTGKDSVLIFSMSSSSEASSLTPDPLPLDTTGGLPQTSLYACTPVLATVPLTYKSWLRH